MKLSKSFGFAFRGIYTLFSSERNAKIHLCATVLVIIAGFIFGISAWQWCAVILCIGAVTAAEGFNTALEKVCDLVSPQYHPLIKAAKDIAAGAVLLLAIASVAVGLIIFLPLIF